MKKCKSCQSNLLDIALFCHNCGRQAEGDAIVCLNCNTYNPDLAKFCYNCGYPINLVYAPNPKISPRYKLDFNEIPTLPTQIRDAFLLELSNFVRLMGESEQEAQYIDCFDSSGFRLQVFEEKAIQLAIKLEEQFLESANIDFQLLEIKIELLFFDLLECFLVKYALALIPYALAPKILNYQGIRKRPASLATMLQDYLSIETEKITAYIHAVNIPVKKLNNARKAYFAHEKGETPLLLIDMSLLGNAKDGVVISNAGIYWKSFLHAASSLSYQQLVKIQLFKDHLEINGIYFNINNSFNFKLFLLLHKLKLLCKFELI